MLQKQEDALNEAYAAKKRLLDQDAQKIGNGEDAHFSAALDVDAWMEWCLDQPAISVLPESDRRTFSRFMAGQAWKPSELSSRLEDDDARTALGLVIGRSGQSATLMIWIKLCRSLGAEPATAGV